MKKVEIFLLSALLVLTLTCFSSAQEPEPQEQEQKLFNAVSISPGFGFEYFSRTIGWDDDEYTSKLKSLFLTLDAEVELQRGIYVRAVFGFSSSSYEALAFRELPVSVRLPEDYIKGFILGAEVRKKLIHSESLRVDAFGQFYYCYGNKKEWEVPGLSVEGSVKGRPIWMRAPVGFIFTYTGYESFFPYINLNFNKLWGKFNMDETIQDLTGREEKKISGESSFCISLGFTIKLTESISFKSEASFMPYKEGTDFGIMVKAMYSLD